MLEEFLSGWDSVMKVALGGFYQKKKKLVEPLIVNQVFILTLKRFHTFYIKIIENPIL